MKPKTWFLKIYLIFVLIFGIIGFIDNFFVVFGFTNNTYSFIILTLTFIFFFFNIVSISIFHYHRLEKINYVLPIYHIISYLFFFSISIILTIYEIFYNWMWLTFMIIGIFAALFEMGFSIYLLKRFSLLKIFKKNLKELIT